MADLLAIRARYETGSSTRASTRATACAYRSVKSATRSGSTSFSPNPPFGGEEEKGIQGNFPEDKQISETALLFLQKDSGMERRLKTRLISRVRGGATLGKFATIALFDRADIGAKNERNTQGHERGAGVCATVREIVDQGLRSFTWNRRRRDKQNEGRSHGRVGATAVRMPKAAAMPVPITERRE